MAQKFEVGAWVLDKKGTIAKIVKRNRTGSYLIKYGPDGPFKTYKGSMLTEAPQERIDLAEGVISEIVKEVCFEEELNTFGSILDEIDKGF